MNREAAASAIEAFLRALGRDAAREPDLAGTPERVARAWTEELLEGYGVDVDALLSQNVFAGTSELVVVRDVPVATVCPHHLMASSGLAFVAYAPEEHLVGVGTVARLVDAFNRGFEGYRAVYRQCTDSAELAIMRYEDEGAKIAANLDAKYGRGG